jgi:hypothetical protein
LMAAAHGTTLDQAGCAFELPLPKLRQLPRSCSIAPPRPLTSSVCAPQCPIARFHCIPLRHAKWASAR